MHSEMEIKRAVELTKMRQEGTLPKPKIKITLSMITNQDSRLVTLKDKEVKI